MLFLLAILTFFIIESNEPICYLCQPEHYECIQNLVSHSQSPAKEQR